MSGGRHTARHMPTGKALAVDIALTLVSMAVLLFAALYVVSPPRITMATEISSVATNSATAIVYGSVLDTDGRPVKGASVVVSRQDGTALVRVLSLVAAADGTFYGAVPAPSGTYRVTVSADVGGRTARDTFSVDMVAGRSYGVRAELVEHEYFSFLPIPSY